MIVNCRHQIQILISDEFSNAKINYLSNFNTLCFKLPFLFQGNLPVPLFINTIISLEYPPDDEYKTQNMFLFLPR